LVDAAARLLEREGASALAVRRIAAEAGVAPMGVYNHLGGKHGVLDALFLRSFDDLRDAMADIAGPDGRGELLEAGLRYRRFALERPAAYHLMFERSVADYEPSDTAKSHAGETFAALAAIVARAMAGGALRVGDPTSVAQAFWSTCHGAVSLELRGLGFVADVDGQYRSLLEALLDGFAS
jgi:AcrR family transcriptional regulator